MTDPRRPEIDDSTDWNAGDPDIWAIDIRYEVWDRLGADVDGGPHEQYAERIAATIRLCVGELEERPVVGELLLARVHLRECEDELVEVLDSDSQEWTTYYDLLSGLSDRNELPPYLLIASLAKVQPEARGRGIGLHALARAIRTWTLEDSMVMLTAWPPGLTGAPGRRGGEALSRYWSQLGLERIEGSVPPILYARTGRKLEERLVDLSRWPPVVPRA